MMTSLFKDFLSILITLTVLLLSQVTFAAIGPYYYLHIESFRNEKNALQSVNNLKRFGIKAVVNKENVPQKGVWYRIYIGHFSSQQEAKLKAAELKTKSIIDYAAIKKKDSIIAGTSAVAVTTLKPKATIPSEKTTGKVQQQQVVILPPKTPTEQKVSSKAAQPSTQTKAVKKSPKAQPKSPKPIVKKGKGRNVPQGSVAVGYKHTYVEINTELTKRVEIETNGGTTITPVPITDDIKNGFPTSMHQDMLYLKLGLTDYFEIFAEGGIAYDTFDNIGYVYGGGLRLNLFQTDDDSTIPGFYAALLGEYLTGEFDEEFTSALGNKFERNTEWQELSAGLEIGISRSRFEAYIGGNYFNYNEDTIRQQLDLTPPVTSHVKLDELEQENNFGIFGGITLYLTRALSINLEGRVIDQKSISGALEYCF
jgi:hypothetical protein